MCEKRHERGACKYTCWYCSLKGHKSEACLKEFPKLRPGVPPRDRSTSQDKKKPGDREGTPFHTKLEKHMKKRSRRSRYMDSRSSSFERSEGEGEKTPPHQKQKRRWRRRSRRVCDRSLSRGVDELFNHGAQPAWGGSKPKLFPDQKIRWDRPKVSTEDPDYSSSIKAFFDDLEYRKEQESVFQQRVRRILKVGQVNTLRSDPRMRGRILGSSWHRNVSGNYTEICCWEE